MKKCKECKLSKKRRDFYGKEICYKCEYKRKMKLLDNNEKICRNCNNVFKARRWIYCTQECADEGKLQQKHWTSNITINSKDWKTRFMY